MDTCRGKIIIKAACNIYLLVAIVCLIIACKAYASEKLHADKDNTKVLPIVKTESSYRLMRAVEWDPEKDPDWKRMSEQLAHWFNYNRPYFTLPDGDVPLKVWQMKDLVDGPDLELSIFINSIGLDESVLINAKILVMTIDEMVGPAALSNEITVDRLPSINWGQFSKFSIYQLRNVPDDKLLKIALQLYDLNDSYDFLSGDSPLHLLALRARIYLFDYNMKQLSKTEILLPVHY